MNEFLALFIEVLSTVFYFAILGRVLMSWISPGGGDHLSTILYQVTEPILGPLRKVLPRLGMLDLSPIAALLILTFLRQFLVSAL